jgi:hypothetical protein
MYDVEYAEPRVTPCACCGNPQTVLTRFVARGETPLAILQAALPEGPHAGKVDLLVSIGDWDDDPTRRRVTGFPLVVTPGRDRHETQAGEPRTTGWSSAWGPCLTAEDARRHPLMPEVLEIVGAVVASDRALAAYLDRHRRKARWSI